MKFAKITLSVALLGALTLGMADEAVVTDISNVESIDAQIAKIQAAPAQERVQLMNEFKEKIAGMNQEDRMATMQEMRAKMDSKSTSEMGSDHGAAAKEMAHGMKDRTMEHSQEMQMQANEQMTQMQNMNQNQSGNQFMDMSGGTMNSSLVDGGAGGGTHNMDFNMPAGH